PGPRHSPFLPGPVARRGGVGRPRRLAPGAVARTVPGPGRRAVTERDDPEPDGRPHDLRATHPDRGTDPRTREHRVRGHHDVPWQPDPHLLRVGAGPDAPPRTPAPPAGGGPVP